MRDFLDSIVEWSGAEEDWRPVPLWTLASWLTFYTLFLLYAFRMHGGFLFIDFANLVVHEGGHRLFGWFGPTLGLWGGTLLQWLVPLLLAACFFRQRHTVAFVFCVFFFFENWLYTANYMADARSMNLPLVSTSGSDFVEHDWNTIFSSLGLLQSDTAIAGLVRFLGWAGMLACVSWFACRTRFRNSRQWLPPQSPSQEAKGCHQNERAVPARTR